HVVGVPLQLAPAREQRLAEFDRLEEPWAAGDDLERTVAFFIKLHGVTDRSRIADQVAALSELFDDLRPCLRRREARQLVVESLRPICVHRLPPGRAPPDRAKRAVR